MEKPRTPMQYISWWNSLFRPQINKQVKNTYEHASAAVRQDFENSREFREFIRQLHNYDSQYRNLFGYDLLMKQPEDVTLEPKQWDNFISKVWRKNVVHNTNWNSDQWDFESSKPDGGWITPDDWYERIHDIVRTRIVVKYLDGVQFLVERMHSHFSSSGCHCEPDWEAREDGYYAAHLNLTRHYQLPIGLQLETKRVCVEVQVTTQIKDVITTLTHRYYERKRHTLELPDIKWQWDCDCTEFAPNYIGHILHYVEGAVMQIRRREEVNDRH